MDLIKWKRPIFNPTSNIETSETVEPTKTDPEKVARLEKKIANTLQAALADGVISEDEAKEIERLNKERINLF